MIIVQGEVYLEQWYIAILKNEQEFVRKRDHVIDRILVGDTIRITKQQAAMTRSIEVEPSTADRIVKNTERRRYKRSGI
jgi:hypothetical protein